MTDFSATPPQVPRPGQKCFLVSCMDGPDAVELRRKHLVDHLQYAEAHWTSYITAGPLSEPGSPAPIGSMFLVLAETLDEARAQMQGDPYVSCGMYASIEFKEFTNAIGQWLGGKIWGTPGAPASRATE